jgi:biopolymer transport protein ExbB
MNLVEWLQGLMTSFGASWVMWLLIGLSVISVAIMLERGWFYFSLRDDIPKLAADLRKNLRGGDAEEALRALEASPSAEAAVVVAGLREADRGMKAADEAMQGAAALQRMKLERRLAYLGTLGNNAPFIGLFGTVIGVVQAFEQLGKQGSMTAAAATSAAPTQVMSAIAEALVATAVGLVVAIPAVAMYNFYQRLSRSTLANTDSLSHVLLSYLAGVEAGHAPPVPASLAKAEKAKAKAAPAAAEDD